MWCWRSGAAGGDPRPADGNGKVRGGRGGPARAGTALPSALWQASPSPREGTWAWESGGRLPPPLQARTWAGRRGGERKGRRQPPLGVRSGSFASPAAGRGGWGGASGKEPLEPLGASAKAAVGGARRALRGASGDRWWDAPTAPRTQEKVYLRKTPGWKPLKSRKRRRKFTAGMT